MKINKQLFEDVLAGKLKGTFVLKNGFTVKSNRLFDSSSTNPYTYCLKGFSTSFTVLGKSSSAGYDIIGFIPDTIEIDTIEIDPELYSYNEKDIQFIEHFINGHHMKENELTIEIPDNKVVDWDESKKQNKIVLKNKQLTYGEVCRKLFGNQDHYHIEHDGSIEVAGLYRCACEPNASKDRHQLECILAKNKLATVAKYLNAGWEPSLTDLGCFDAWVLYLTPYNGYIGCVKTIDFVHNSNVMFKSKELAQQAIEILGEETVKLALEPLGI